MGASSSSDNNYSDDDVYSYDRQYALSSDSECSSKSKWSIEDHVSAKSMNEEGSVASSPAESRRGSFCEDTNDSSSDYYEDGDIVHLESDSESNTQACSEPDSVERYAHIEPKSMIS